MERFVCCFLKVSEGSGGEVGGVGLAGGASYILPAFVCGHLLQSRMPCTNSTIPSLRPGISVPMRGHPTKARKRICGFPDLVFCGRITSSVKQKVLVGFPGLLAWERVVSSATT